MSAGSPLSSPLVTTRQRRGAKEGACWGVRGGGVSVDFEGWLLSLGQFEVFRLSDSNLRGLLGTF